MQARTQNLSPDDRPRLLLVDDNESHCWTTQRVFEKRGYSVRVGHSVEQACGLLVGWPAAYALVELRLQGASGLELIPLLRAGHPQMRIVVLTAYASIATAVKAIKLGATHYLAKPAHVETIEAAFARARGDETVPASERPLSVDRLEWEHIQHVLTELSGNLSAAARALSMHRRTLQRKLNKHAPRAFSEAAEEPSPEAG